MAGETIPELTYHKPDGSLLSRIEMEEHVRQVWPKIYWLRMKANKVYGLTRQAAFDMRQAVLLHWTLDEMIRQGHVVGDISGVDPQTYNDEASSRQFIQRLQYLIQSGQALTPHEGEGVDMSQFTPPPPPMGGPPGAPPPNGGQVQQPMQFQPPAPQGFAPPQMPAGMPQTAPPPMGPPQMQPQQGMMPPGAPQFAPPMPGAGMPQMPSTPVPPMPGSPPPQMPQAAPQGGGRGGRGKRGGGDQQAQGPAPGASPVPPMPQGGPPPQNFAPPGQFGPPGAPPPMMPPQGFNGAPQQGGYAPPPPGAPAPQQFAPPVQQQAPQAAPVVAAPDPAVQQKLDQILSNQARLTSDLEVIKTGLCVALRATYQKPGAADLRAFLGELGLQIPQ